MIEIDGLTKTFGGFTAIDSLSLTIARGEFFALLGASGSGKTTLLRLLGGFEFPTQGRVRIDGQDVTDLRANRRPTNTVFQSYALFPHLTLAQNVGYGLLNAGLSRSEIADRVADALARVRLSDLGTRFPHQVSGGQRQRVALARALICRPKVLLLDEPLGALDKRLREEMHVELREIQRAAGITFVLVTHDQEEAMSLADRIAVLARGRLLQVDTPHRLYEAPQTRAVAEFISNVNLIAGRARRTPDGGLEVEADGLGRFAAVAPEAGLMDGAPVTLAIRPEKLRLADAPDTRENSLRGTLRATTYAGDRTLVTIDVPGLPRPLLLTLANTQRHQPATPPPGATVVVAWQPGAAAVLTK
jgi:ABC-type Fe3+/spermidine/putrescine transport system ATPase subunit